MSIYKMFKSGEEKFEKKFPFSIIEPITSHNLKSHIKQFRKQEYISIIKGEIERKKIQLNQIAIEFTDYPSKMWKLHNGKMPFVLWKGKADEDEKFQIWRTGFNEASNMTRKILQDQISHLQSELKAIEEDK